MRAVATSGTGRAGPQRSDPARRWRAAATSAVLASIAAIVALHVLRPDLDPAGHRLSEYATGPWGWLMTAAFVAFAGSMWAVRRVLQPRAGLGAVRLLLALAAGGMLLSAVFETDVTSPAATRELVHSMASSAAFICLIAAALWMSTVARTAVTWPMPAVVTDVVTALATLGAVLSPITHDGGWTGVVQRCSYLAIAVWLLLLACATPAAMARSTGPDDAHRAGR